MLSESCVTAGRQRSSVCGWHLVGTPPVVVGLPCLAHTVSMKPQKQKTQGHEENAKNNSAVTVCCHRGVSGDICM